MFNQKWEKIDSKVIHKNPWYELVQDDVLMPSGQQGKYTYVNRHEAAVIIPMTDNNEIYLIKQYRYPVQEFTWEFPAGSKSLEPETIEQVAKRELLEEVGLSANQWDYLGELFYAAGTSNQRAKIFLARGLEKQNATPDLTEFISFKTVSMIELEEMINKNEFKEGADVAAFYLLKKFLTLK
ncbi:NUDIX hydrolase [Candidatus Falkowbacteria bacterium]|nr:NUDIX hydrolase [Candidatus Falkowbacteria bacterium]